MARRTKQKPRRRLVKKKKTRWRRPSLTKQSAFTNIITHATEQSTNRTNDVLPEFVTTSPFPLSTPPTIQSGDAQLLTIESGFAFAYWEVDPDSLQRTIERAGPSAKMFLRFYDVTATSDMNRSPQWDVEVFDREGNWYLKLEHPGQKLCFDIGVKNRGGHFFPLTRSNITWLTHDILAHPTQFTGRVEPSPGVGRLAKSPVPFAPPEMKRILGPYFFDLYVNGRLGTIGNTSLAAIFNDLAALRSHE